MAGKPKQKAKQSSLIADTAHEAYKQVIAICPSQYTDMTRTYSLNDKLAWAWRGTITRARCLLVEAEQLELLLYEKAELPAPAIRDENAYNDDPWVLPNTEQPEDAVQSEDDGIIITGNCATTDSLHWVIENLEKSVVHKQDAPSNTAWTLYKWASSNPINRADFINRSWGKLIPSNKQLENEDRMRDDGRDIQDLIASILAMHQDEEEDTFEKERDERRAEEEAEYQKQLSERRESEAA